MTRRVPLVLRLDTRLGYAQPQGRVTSGGTLGGAETV